MSEEELNRELWIALRRCLLGIANAIAKRYQLDKYAPPKIVTVQEGESIG